MKFSAYLFSFFALLALAACHHEKTESLEGNWALKADESHLSFVSVKAGDIAEVHSFKRLGGAVAADGTATLTVGLDTVATNIDIRDERMREFLFETGVYPNATVSLALDPGAFAGLGIGESLRQDVTAELFLHGMTEEIEATLVVTRLGPDTVMVNSLAPVIIQADSFGLLDGIEKLRELAGLPEITPLAPVTFSLMFGKDR